MFDIVPVPGYLMHRFLLDQDVDPGQKHLDLHRLCNRYVSGTIMTVYAELEAYKYNIVEAKQFKHMSYKRIY